MAPPVLRAYLERWVPHRAGCSLTGTRPSYAVYILFEDFTHVKFYRLSLRDSVELDAGAFADGFHHVDDWVPQRLVTATGPNPLPR